MEIIKHFESNQVRIDVDEKGDIWWCAHDVCTILGIANTPQAVSALKPTEKNTICFTDGIPGNPNMTFINEQGLYRLIFKSRKPEAEQFVDWVFGDVLPELRKTGSYFMPARDPIEKAQIAYNACLKMAGQFDLKGNHAKLAANRATKTLTGIDPMELLGVTHLEAEVQERHITATEIAQRLGLSSGRYANLLLKASGYQVDSRDHAGKLVWTPTVKADGLYCWLDTGKARGDGTPVLQLKWYESIISLLEQDHGE